MDTQELFYKCLNKNTRSAEFSLRLNGELLLKETKEYDFFLDAGNFWSFVKPFIGNKHSTFVIIVPKYENRLTYEKGACLCLDHEVYMRTTELIEFVFTCFRSLYETDLKRNIKYQISVYSKSKTISLEELTYWKVVTNKEKAKQLLELPISHIIKENWIIYSYLWGVRYVCEVCHRRKTAGGKVIGKVCNVSRRRPLKNMQNYCHVLGSYDDDLDFFNRRQRNFHSRQRVKRNLFV